MKKIFMCLGLVALLAGCASNDNGMGGTSDETYQSSQSSESSQSKPSNDSLKTDTYNSSGMGSTSTNNNTQVQP